LTIEDIFHLTSKENSLVKSICPWSSSNTVDKVGYFVDKIWFGWWEEFVLSHTEERNFALFFFNSLLDVLKYVFNLRSYILFNYHQGSRKQEGV